MESGQWKERKLRAFENSAESGFEPTGSAGPGGF
jgi:hypothetical protein